MAFEEKRRKLFTDLLSAQWKHNGQSKYIWEYMRDKVLSATPAFEGTEYSNAKTKVMFVGRALNGWELDVSNCTSIDNTVDYIVNQSSKHVFDTFIDSKGFGEGKRKYKHINSRFFRFIKRVLEELGESDIGVSDTWYTDSKKWNQKFVWANLYCISPRNGNNPIDSLIKKGIENYVELIKLYIDHYCPDVVVFITDLEGWMIIDTWKVPMFTSLFANYQEYDNNNFIRATGTISNSKAIVCQRPDKQGAGYTYEYTQKMAEFTAREITNMIQ